MQNFYKIRKVLGLYLAIKTAALQDIIYTTLGNDSKVTIDRLFSYLPAFTPDTATQRKIIDPIKNSFTISFDSSFTDGSFIDTGLKNQLDIRSFQDVNIPNFIIAAQQTAARM